MSSSKDDKPKLIDLGNGLSSLSEALGEIRTEYKKLASPEQQREATRGRVTHKIVNLYFISVGIIVLFGSGAIYYGARANNAEMIQLVISSMSELVGFMSVLVLPVITLVLGFYFGSEKRG